MKIFVDTVGQHIRKNHTDWRALRYLAELTRYEKEISLHFSDGVVHSAVSNMLYVAEVIGARMEKYTRLRTFPKWRTGRLDEAELKRVKPDVIYSHSEFPRNTRGVPLVWRNVVLDPSMQRARGVNSDALKREIEFKRPLFLQCAIVHVSSRAEVARMEGIFPEARGRFVAVPYFLPYLSSNVKLDAAIEKQSRGPVKILFVGRQARRKGLDLLLGGFRAAGLVDSQDAEITIVSDMSDGRIDIPKWKNLRHFARLSGPEVLNLMEESHVLAMPSRFESYGIVYVEAMSMGTVPIVPAWEVQREIVQDGEAGIATALTCTAIGDALARIACDSEYRVRLAVGAVQRFCGTFSPGVVGEQLVQMFRRAAGSDI